MSDADASSVDERPRRMTEIGEESRRRILDAAEKLFIERGVADTSFASIQREAGISRGSIPWHFTNKNGLLLAIVERATLLVDPHSTEGVGEAGVAELFDRARQLIHEPQATLLLALLSESLRPDSVSHERFRDWQREVRDRIAEILRGLFEVQPPRRDVDADQLATVIFGAIIGIQAQWQLAPDLVDLDAAFDALEATVYAALGDDADPSTTDA